MEFGTLYNTGSPSSLKKSKRNKHMTDIDLPIDSKQNGQDNHNGYQIGDILVEQKKSP